MKFKMFVLSLVMSILGAGLVYGANMETNSDTAQTTADEAIAAYISGGQEFRNALNQVAQSNASSVHEKSLRDGTEVRTEVRELSLDNGITIVNTRVISITREMTRTASDSYGLFYAGIAGSGGTLTATYKYEYTVIENPNQMKTRILNASGTATDLKNEYYKCTSIDPNWETLPSYTAGGSVKFNIQSKDTLSPIWTRTPYIHTIRFDKYGIEHMSW